MNPLYMIELRPNMTALLRFLRDQGLASRDSDEDLGYGIHAWMKAAFGPLAPKPWRLFHGRGRPTRILGYSAYDESELRQRIIEFAPPSVLAVAETEGAIASKQMPAWQRGRQLFFEVQACPVGRKSRSGVEKDIFLLQADHHSKRVLDRGQVYGTWAAERLERNNAARVDEIHMTQFRLVRLLRRTTQTSQGRRPRQLIRPSVQLQGELIVGDPEAFASLLAKGLGRHRAFGYGMLLVGPPR